MKSEWWLLFWATALVVLSLINIVGVVSSGHHFGIGFSSSSNGTSSITVTPLGTDLAGGVRDYGSTTLPPCPGFFVASLEMVASSSPYGSAFTTTASPATQTVAPASVTSKPAPRSSSIPGTGSTVSLTPPPATSSPHVRLPVQYWSENPNAYIPRHEDVEEEVLRLGLSVREMGGEGDCLFRVLSDQLFGTVGSHVQIRERVADFLERHSDMFAEFFRSDEWQQLPEGQRETVGAYVQAEDWLGYCNFIRQPGHWGGGIELLAAASIWGFNIQVVEPAVTNTFEPAPDGLADRPPSEDDARHNAELRDARPTLFLARIVNHFQSLRFPGILIGSRERSPNNYPATFYARPHHHDQFQGAMDERARLDTTGATAAWEQDVQDRRASVLALQEKRRVDRQEAEHRAARPAFTDHTISQRHNVTADRNQRNGRRSSATTSSRPGGDLYLGLLPQAPPLDLGVGFANVTVRLASGRQCRIEDVRVGDLLMGPDSQPRAVLAVSASDVENVCQLTILKGNTDTRDLYLTCDTMLPLSSAPDGSTTCDNEQSMQFSLSGGGSIVDDAVAILGGLLGGKLVSTLPGDNDRTTLGTIRYPSNGDDFTTVLRRAIGYHLSIKRSAKAQTLSRNVMAGTSGVGSVRGAYVVRWERKHADGTLHFDKWFVHDRTHVRSATEPTVWCLGDPDKAYTEALKFSAQLHASDNSLLNIKQRYEAALADMKADTRERQIPIDKAISGLSLNFRVNSQPHIRSTFRTTRTLDDGTKKVDAVTRIFNFDGEVGLAQPPDATDMTASVIVKDVTELVAERRKLSDVSLTPEEWAELSPVDRDQHALRTVEAIDFPFQPLPVHPQIIGMILGDGCRDRPTFANFHESELTSFLGEVAVLHGSCLTYQGSFHYHIGVPRPSRSGGTKVLPEQRNTAVERRVRLPGMTPQGLLRQRLDAGCIPVPGTHPGQRLWRRADGVVVAARLDQVLATAQTVTLSTISHPPRGQVDADNNLPDPDNVETVPEQIVSPHDGQVGNSESSHAQDDRFDAIDLDDLLVEDKEGEETAIRLRRLPPVALNDEEVAHVAGAFGASKDDNNPVQSILHALQSLGVFPPAYDMLHGPEQDEKGIPDLVLFNSRDVRLHALAGLLATDGSYMPARNRYTFAQSARCHERLFYDTADLARGLGFTVAITRRNRGHRYKDGSPVSDMLTMSIGGNHVDEIPSILSRKQGTNLIIKSPFWWKFGVDFYDGEGPVLGRAKLRREHERELGESLPDTKAELEAADIESDRRRGASEFPDVTEAQDDPLVGSPLDKCASQSPMRDPLKPEPDAKPDDGNVDSPKKRHHRGHPGRVYHLHVDGDGRFLRFDRTILESFKPPSITHTTNELNAALHDITAATQATTTTPQEWSRLHNNFARQKRQLQSLHAAKVVYDLSPEALQYAERSRYEDNRIEAWRNGEIDGRALQLALNPVDHRTLGSRARLQELSDRMSALSLQLEEYESTLVPEVGAADQNEAPRNDLEDGGGGSHDGANVGRSGDGGASSEQVGGTELGQQDGGSGWGGVSSGRRSRQEGDVASEPELDNVAAPLLQELQEVFNRYTHLADRWWALGD